MPNAKVLSEKQAIVAELTEKIQKATAGVIVDYKGITVEEDTALRKECREGGVDYAVVKNTLLRFAFNNTGLNDLDDLLNGTTSLALADDPVAPARVMADYAKKLDGKFEIKGGFMDGKPVDLATIQSLASIPALPVLQAQVLGTMLAPITGLAVVLKQIAEKNGAPAEEAAAEAAQKQAEEKKAAKKTAAKKPAEKAAAKKPAAKKAAAKKPAAKKPAAKKAAKKTEPEDDLPF